MKTIPLCPLLVFGLATTLVASAALAQQNAPADATVPFGAAAAPIATTELSTIAGQADTAMEIRAQNTSTVSHNSVIGQSETGAISFDSAAFQNMAGLSLLSANTGNNVSINSSLNVNVSIQPQ